MRDWYSVKSKDFFATQILREIKFGNFGIPWISILTFLLTQNLELFGIFLQRPNSISRKIWVVIEFILFHTV